MRFGVPNLGAIDLRGWSERVRELSLFVTFFFTFFPFPFSFFFQHACTRRSQRLTDFTINISKCVFSRTEVPFGGLDYENVNFGEWIFAKYLVKHIFETTPCLKKTVPTYFLLLVCQIWTEFNKNWSIIPEETCNKTMGKVPTSPKVCACTTLGNFKCQIEPSTQ